ncbi:MAG TPA: peptidoglycan editing factor PgeF [Bryobacteraceae bacterium]
MDFIEFDFGTRNSVFPSDIVTVHQVHSASVRVNHGQARCADDKRPDADALVENTPGVAVGVRTADCVPVLLADPVRRVVAAVHAGWRGTAAQIVPVTLQTMDREFGSRADDVHAAIGPSIGPCCYEVGPEVAREFGVTASGRVHLDLWRMNAKQLMAAGVRAENISVAEDCSMCNSATYHSFRRDREAAGRMISWIRIRPQG